MEPLSDASVEAMVPLMTTNRLVPRLVPAPLWGLSGARLLPRAEWRQIRLDALEAAAGACSVCGTARDKGMICDEEWTYSGGVALLTSVRIACPDCDAVTHIGSTGSRGYYAVARDHMARIDSITAIEADRLVEGQMAIWRQQSRQNWTIDVAPALLERYPQLAILVGLVGKARR